MDYRRGLGKLTSPVINDQIDVTAERRDDLLSRDRFLLSVAIRARQRQRPSHQTQYRQNQLMCRYAKSNGRIWCDGSLHQVGQLTNEAVLAIMFQDQRHWPRPTATGEAPCQRCHAWHII